MVNLTPIISFIDEVAPGLHWLAVAITLIGIPSLLWVVKVRFDWRKDNRETRDNVTVLMGRLVDQQRAELNRLITEADALRDQLSLFVEGRWQLQRALDDLRDQLIAARVTIHDYERRLSLPETTFPQMPALGTLGAK